MSRIDEALRRAAQDAPDADQVASSDEVSGMELADLVHEAYPVELTKRRSPLREATHAAPGPWIAPVSTAAADGHGEQAGAHGELRRPERLLRITQHALAEKLVIDNRMSPGSLEQYRRLAATLHHAQAADGLKVVMIASAVQGEGKTLTAANLALTLSESYQRRVLLIDADLRRPSQHVVFDVDNSSGLTDITAKNREQLSVRVLSPRLALLTAGPPSADPMAGLTSDRMRRVIEEARQEFEWVIVDTPPLVLMPDANLLTAMVDGAVLVLRAASTPFDLVSRAIAAVGRERILGVVLNGAEYLPHSGYGYGYGYHYYAADKTTTVPAKKQ